MIIKDFVECLEKYKMKESKRKKYWIRESDYKVIWFLSYFIRVKANRKWEKYLSLVSLIIINGG